MVKKETKKQIAEGAGAYVERDTKGRIIAAYSTPQRGPAIYGDVEKEIVKQKRVKGAEGEDDKIEEVKTTVVVNEVVGYEPGRAEEWVDGEVEIYVPLVLDQALVEREKRLKESDWVVIRAMERGEDVPAAWKNYRDALRGIDESTDLDDFEWPEKPE